MAYSVGVAQSDGGRGPFGALMHATRKRAGLTHEDVYKATGVSRSTLSRWENGHTDKPEPDELALVVEFIGLPLEDAYRALGRIPATDETEPDDSPYTDPTERKLWALADLTEAERRGLIALLRGLREMRKSDAI